MPGLKRVIIKIRDAGFTLIELMVVVLLIGILSAIAIPRYLKTVETAKAHRAASTVIMIGKTNEMFFLDNRVYAQGQLKNDPCKGDCPVTIDPQGPPQPACTLVTCKYLATQEWEKGPYLFEAVAAASSGCGFSQPKPNMMACAKRGPGPPAPKSPYSTWGYTIDSDGDIKAQGTDTPKPIK